MEDAFPTLYDSPKSEVIDDDLLPQLNSDDWINQLHVFDLPQFFTADSSDSNVYHPSPESPTKISNKGPSEPTQAEINAVIQQHVTRDLQHSIPGPVKRSRTGTNPPVEATTTSAVRLTRDQLLSFSSEDMDAFENNITSVRPLTPAERKEMKRQRRLIKNRESAQLSRRRKKDLVGELEHIVGDLSTKSSTLQRKLQDLEAENVVLKAEVSQLIGVIRDSPILSNLLRNVTSMLVYYAIHASKPQNVAAPQNLPTQSSIEAC